MKTCSVCLAEFTPARPMQSVCSPKCAGAKVRQDRAAKKAKLALEKRETKERKEALKRRSDLVEEAQKAFNAWIRERDHDKPCISCGRSGEGTLWNAGHYLSTQARPELRFEPDNVHKQCVHCNLFKASNAIEYRIRLIEKVGLARVEWLEAHHETPKLSREAIATIKRIYAKAAKDLRARRML
jgi:Bacteriophage Lambda NinG protein